MAPKLGFTPVWAGWPQKRKNVYFGPLALGVFLVVFLILGFATNEPFIALTFALPLAVGGAWALVGWPVVRLPDGRPLVEPKLRPYLFFPAFFLLALVLYPFVGVWLTMLALPPKWVALVSLGAALPAAAGIAYLLFGFPSFWRHVRESYAGLPADRRPFLFFPLFAVIFLILYLSIGVATTKALDNFQDRTVLLLNVQVMFLLPLCLVLAALAAYLLVGFPVPRRRPAEYLPKVTGRHRPKAFLATFLIAGLPLTILVGALLGYAAANTNASAFLPAEVQLPLALALGYSLSLGLAAVWWGTPRRWRRYDDYEPGLSPRARLGAAGTAALAVLLAVTVGAGLAGVDIFWGLLVGALLGGIVALVITGAHRRVAARRGAPTLLPDLPERAKSLVLFTSWLVLALVIGSVLTYALPDLVGWNVLLALLVGLGVSLFAVEQGLLKDALTDRRKEREKRKAWKARRKEALARGDEAGGAR